MYEENFEEDGIQHFAPDQGIFNESQADKQARGNWNMAPEGERVNFSLQVKNRSAATIVLELFNAQRTVLKYANGSLYSKNATAQQYGPHSQLRALYEVALLSAAAAASAPIAITADPTCFTDGDGNFIFTSDRTYANIKLTMENMANAGLDCPGTQGVNIPDAYIVCNELPYSALLEDINSGLVLDVNQMRVQTSDVLFFQTVITYNRWQSFGGTQSNPLPWSVGRDPKNNLTDTMDIMKQFLIDNKTGLYLKLLSGVSVSITFFATAYRNNAVKWSA